MAAPPSRAYRLRKFVRKHRGAVIAASLVLLALLGGLAAVAAVQTVANARLAASLKRETNANAALNEANGQLSQSRAAVQARYELATDAIKTFHTGVSEDFLLKEEKFKDLRNRLLKSASDFYGKLGALLGKETDLASRRALAQANFELADLTDKVGRKEDALAAHRQVLAAREALAAEPGADVETKVDVGRSLTAVAGLLSAAGKTDEAEATYRKAETLLADLARSSPSTQAARAALAYCRTGMGRLRYDTGKFVDALVSYRLARDDQEALADAPGASKEARRDLAETIHRTAILLIEHGQEVRGGGRVPQGDRASAEAGRRLPRRHRVPLRPGEQPQQPRHPAVGYGQAVGSGGRVPQGDRAHAEAGRREPRRHRIPPRPGSKPAATSPCC